MDKPTLTSSQCNTNSFCYNINFLPMFSGMDSSYHLVVHWKTKSIEKSKNINQKVEVRPMLKTYQWESVTSIFSIFAQVNITNPTR